MSKVLVGFVSVYPGPAGMSRRVEANRLMEVAKMKSQVNFGLDSLNVQLKSVKFLDGWQPAHMKGRRGQKRQVMVFVEDSS